MAHLLPCPILSTSNFYICTVWSTYTVPGIALFFCSLIACFLSVFLRYFLNNLETFPVAPILFLYILHRMCLQCRSFFIQFLLLLFCHLTQAFSSCYFSTRINGDPLLSDFTFEAAVLSVLCAILLVHLSLAVSLLIFSWRSFQIFL